MIRIAISQAAFEAIARTLPLGSVGFENAVDERGRRYVWLAPAVVELSAASTFEELGWLAMYRVQPTCGHGARGRTQGARQICPRKRRAAGSRVLWANLMSACYGPGFRRTPAWLSA
jgi:hypothetical protein